MGIPIGAIFQGAAKAVPEVAKVGKLAALGKWLGLPSWTGKALHYGGTAATGLFAADAGMNLSDSLLGTDIFGGKHREAMMLENQMKNAMLDGQEATGKEINEKMLRDMLMGMGKDESVPTNQGVKGMEDAESLKNVLMSNQAQIAQLSQSMQGPSYEEMALGLGY